ncbi:MAG: hypothetical protein IKT35_01880 [Clostridia bacterium]|nr:hypothetical protein [Clostridia bacterium]
MKNKGVFRKICITAGACLLVLAIGLLISWQWGIHSSIKKAESTVTTIFGTIPEVQNSALEERQNNTMPTLNVDGKDFVGVLEMPRYNSSLPVCGDWGSVSKYPCNFYGSIYDGTMQIGLTSQKGQYDFYREISVGDTVTFTDVEGNRYTYLVTDLRYEKHADKSTLEKEESSLTLFIKNVYGFEYLIVYCNVAK